MKFLAIDIGLRSGWALYQVGTRNMTGFALLDSGYIHPSRLEVATTTKVRKVVMPNAYEELLSTKGVKGIVFEDAGAIAVNSGKKGDKKHVATAKRLTQSSVYFPLVNQLVVDAAVLGLRVEQIHAQTVKKEVGAKGKGDPKVAVRNAMNTRKWFRELKVTDHNEIDAIAIGLAAIQKGVFV